MKKSNILLTFFFFLAVSCLPAQDVEHPSMTAEEVVTRLYNLVTFDAGTTPDWDSVRSLFLPEAVVVLRTSRELTSVFSVEGFVDDFVQFIERVEAEKTGFREEIISMKTMIFGDMADIWVLYEASIPGSQRPPQKGVDFFSLIKKEGQWIIVSVTNEIPTSERPVPQIF